MRASRRVRPHARSFLIVPRCVLEFRESFVSPYADASVDRGQAQLRSSAADHAFGALSWKLAMYRQLKICPDGAVLGLGTYVGRGAARHFERYGSIDGGEIQRAGDFSDR